MKKLLFILFAFTVAMPSFAQEKKSGSFVSVNVGGGAGSFNPSIKSKVTTTYSDGKKEENREGYKFKYDAINFFADVEYTFNGFTTLFEGCYGQAKNGEWEMKTKVTNPLVKLDESKFEDKASFYSGSVYIGPILFPKKRFQMPILGGIGLTYNDGEPFNKLSFDFCYKVRAKFYITRNVGLFAGVSGNIGIAGDTEVLGGKEDDKADITMHRLSFEGGLTVMLGRKK
jgi:hypothetical protein